jgi:hypothetical protein
MFIANFMKGFDGVMQNLIMEMVVSHDFLVYVVAPYLQYDIKIPKHNQELIENFRSSLSSHMTNVQILKLVMAKDIVCTFASF